MSTMHEVQGGSTETPYGEADKCTTFKHDDFRHPQQTLFFGICTGSALVVVLSSYDGTYWVLFWGVSVFVGVLCGCFEISSKTCLGLFDSYFARNKKGLFGVVCD